jgi:sulfite reductase (NADPH) hemoprotein beta-component
MSEFVEREDILAYLEAVLRVYNQDSRRDNIHKQRIKILINTIGPEEMRRRVAREFEELKRMGTLQLPQEELDRITAYFAPPKFETGLSDVIPDAGPDFANWAKTNIHKHKAPGYAIVTITLKTPGQVPGDATSEQMDTIADLMDRFSLGEVRVTHEQNLVLPHVRKQDLPAIHSKLKELDFASPNAGLITDIIACPGLDYCDPCQCTFHPHRPDDREEIREAGPPARDRRTEDQDLRLHQRLRPPPCRPYRHLGRG